MNLSSIISLRVAIESGSVNAVLLFLNPYIKMFSFRWLHWCCSQEWNLSLRLQYVYCCMYTSLFVICLLSVLLSPSDLFYNLQVESLAVQLNHREGELIQEKAEVKRLATFLKRVKLNTFSTWCLFASHPMSILKEGKWILLANVKL